MTKDEFESMKNEMMADSQKTGRKDIFSLDAKKDTDSAKIRFIPPLSKKGEKVFYHKIFTHWIDGKRLICSNSVTYDKDGNVHEPERCPICDYVSKLYKTADRGSEEWKLANLLRRKERYISRVIVRDSEEPQKPKFYEYGPTIYQMLYNYIINTEFGNIVDPKTGRDFNLVKTGVGRDCKYTNSSPAIKETPLFDNKDQLLEALKNASEMNYNELCERSTPAELKKALDEYLGNYDENDNKNFDVDNVSVGNVGKTSTSSVSEISGDNSEDTTDDIDDILNEFTN